MRRAGVAPHSMSSCGVGEVISQSLSALEAGPLQPGVAIVAELFRAGSPGYIWSIAAWAASRSLTQEVSNMQRFRPGRPMPTHRMPLGQA